MKDEYDGVGFACLLVSIVVGQFIEYTFFIILKFIQNFLNLDNLHLLVYSISS